MKRIQLFYFFAFLALGVAITGCKDDEDEGNQITITIEEPIDGENIAIANCGDVHVHVDISATDENHEIEIILHPEDDVNDLIINYDAHAHDQVIEFEQEVDLCAYAAGTCFHLEVFACVDHDCEERAFGEAEFCLE